MHIHLASLEICISRKNRAISRVSRWSGNNEVLLVRTDDIGRMLPVTTTGASRSNTRSSKNATSGMMLVPCERTTGISGSSFKMACANVSAVAVS